jgi:hypothetical protein
MLRLMSGQEKDPDDFLLNKKKTGQRCQKVLGKGRNNSEWLYQYMDRKKKKSNQGKTYRSLLHRKKTLLQEKKNSHYILTEQITDGKKSW